jgi:7-cyano-7-deazaguanine synthase
VVLLSGGMDSALTAVLAQSAGFDVYALTFDYGQRHAIEVARAAEVAIAIGVVEHRVMSIDLAAFGGSSLTDRSIAVPQDCGETKIGERIPSTYVPARNTVFLALAMAWAEALGARDLFIGANVLDYSGYPDCRPEFLEAFQALARLATGTGVEGADWTVHAPLICMTKAQIVARAVELGLDLGRTLSCYIPEVSGAPCGRCEACRLRARGFAEAGLSDPALDSFPRN